MRSRSLISGCGIFIQHVFMKKEISAWCINLDKRPEKYQEFVKEPIPFPTTRFTGIENNNPMLGCIASHLEVMKLFGNGINIIFEDDAQIISGWDHFETALDQLPSTWHCLYLGAMLHKPVQKYSEHLFKLHNAWCTHAVAYNGKTIAAELLKHSPDHVHKAWNNIDTYMAREIQPRFNCFLINPMIAVQRENHSDIINAHRSYPFIENFKKHTSCTAKQ